MGANSTSAHFYDAEVGSDGNIYASGIFHTSLEIMGQQIIGRPEHSGIIASFTPDDSLRWLVEISGTDEIHSVRLPDNPVNQLVVTGRFYDTLLWGGSMLVQNTPHSCIFIGAMDFDGNLLWLKKIVEPFGYPIENGRTDRFGNLYMQIMGDSVFFGNDTLTGGINLLKVDPSGNLIWAKELAVDNASISRELVLDLDSASNIFMGGNFWDTVSGEGVNLIPDGFWYVDIFGDSTWNVQGDLFLMKYNSAGSFQWLKTITSADNFNFDEGKTDIKGDFYFGLQALTGSVITYDTTTTFTLSDYREIVGITSSGDFKWSSTFPYTADIRNLEIEEDKLYFCGLGIPWNAYVVTMDTTGYLENRISATSSGTNNQPPFRIVSDHAGSLYMAGCYLEEIDFGLGNVLYNADSRFEAYLVKLNSPILGLNEGFPESSEIFAYPNPFRNEITIVYSEEDIAAVKDVVLYDLNGRETALNWNIIAPGRMLLSIEDGPPGIYVVEISGQNQIHRTKILRGHN